MQLHIRPLAKNEKFLNEKYFFQKVAKSVRFASEMSGLRIGKLLKTDFRFIKNIFRTRVARLAIR